MERVFVFGAGASKHANGPLMADFVDQAFYHLCAGSLYRIDKSKFWTVVDMLDDLMGLGLRKEVQWAIDNHQVTIKNPHKLYGISVEALLTRVEAGLFGDMTEQYREAVQCFIFQPLQSLTTHSDSYAWGQDGQLVHSRNYYDRLVDYGLDYSETNRCLTFNYDRNYSAHRTGSMIAAGM